MSPSARPDLRWLGAQPYAHRGLHAGKGAAGLPVENSRTAFKAAIAAGHGIECDVQPAADGTAFVFHDATLNRLTDASGRVAALAPDILDTIVLKRTNETIPRLSELLTLVKGRVPLLIEIKADSGHVAALCASVASALARYKGPVAVMSFDSSVGGWFRRHAPQIVRGLVVSEEHGKGWWGSTRRYLGLGRAKPHFLAYDVRDLPSPFVSAQAQQGMPVLSWTVRSEDQWQTVAAHADAAIYERMPPA